MCFFSFILPNVKCITLYHEAEGSNLSHYRMTNRSGKNKNVRNNVNPKHPPFCNSITSNCKLKASEEINELVNLFADKTKQDDLDFAVKYSS